MKKKKRCKLGSAVSAVTNTIGGGLGKVANTVGNLGTVQYADTNAAQQAMNAQANNVQGINNFAGVQATNANQLMAQANATLPQYQGALQQGQNLVDAASNYLPQTQQAINQANASLTPAQAAITNAQETNQGVGSNVNNAIGLVGQTAAGGGAAQQAAAAQLQAGNDQAIAQQHALANSGNLSQMIGGQKNAMENAAMLAQQNANQAAGLRANMSATAQGAYAQAAAQQASQSAQNAGLQQTQVGLNQSQAGLQQGQATAAMNLANTQQQQTAAQAGLYGTQLGAAQQFSNIAGSNLANAATAQGSIIQGQGNTLAAQQGANSQQAQIQSGMVGGLLNGVGGAAASKMMAAAHGGKIPGEEKPGDKLENDTQPAMLSPGEIVVPKSALKSKEKAIAFLMAAMEGKGPKPKEMSREELMKNKKDKSKC